MRVSTLLFLCAEDILWNGKHNDSRRVEKFQSALFLVVDKKASLMSLSDYCVICFPILEYDHFYLVCFDMENNAITVIDNMDVKESPIQLIDDDNFFKKTTPYKVKDIFCKYLKPVNHPKCTQIENALPHKLDFEWMTVNSMVDCGVFVMRHMETWFGITVEKWDSGFPLVHTAKKACLTRLRKKYAVKLVTSNVNKHRKRIMAEAVKYEKASEIGCNWYVSGG
ncbi:putative papain-like cysteine peptidase superfamily [Helianthus annuus]|nr:putative papain-like cysteine peptidase superfamily [Helianthus annuus]